MKCFVPCIISHVLCCHLSSCFYRDNMTMAFQTLRFCIIKKLTLCDIFTKISLRYMIKIIIAKRVKRQNMQSFVISAKQRYFSFTCKKIPSTYFRGLFLQFI